jgi:hypothetical protein
MAHVVGNPAYLYTPKIPNLVRNHLNLSGRCNKDLNRLSLSEKLAVIEFTLCRLGRRCTRELCSFYHSDRSSFPPAPQPESLHPMMNRGIPDPPVLGSDTGISRENEGCVSIGGYLASNLPPSLEGHTTSATGGHLFKGASRPRRRHPRRHPLASIRPLLNAHLPLSFPQSCLTDVFDSEASEPPLVQSPRETSVPSGSSRFQSSDSQCYLFKDLVDELPPFPFVHSPFINSQRKVGRSAEYEDLLKDAKEKSPLRRRRTVRGVTYAVKI